MKILTVLNARAGVPCDVRERHAADRELWPAGVAAIAFVITTPDRPALIAVLSDAIRDRHGEGATGVGPGIPPQPPRMPPGFQLQPARPREIVTAAALATCTDDS